MFQLYFLSTGALVVQPDVSKQKGKNVIPEKLEFGMKYPQ